MKTLLCAAAGVGMGVSGAAAQCGFTVSLWESFRAGQTVVVGGRQVAGDAYSFRRDDYAGTLLTAIPLSGPGLPCAWGDVTQQYSVPVSGSIFSPDPLLEQVPFHDRASSFTGIMLHPGYGAINCVAVFTAQTGMVVSSLDLSTEMLGNISDGARATVLLVTAAGGVSTVGGPVTSYWGNAADHTPIHPINPWLVQPGDRFVVVTNSVNEPYEDWLNVELKINVLSGAPVIMAQPRGVAVCPGLSATLSVAAVGAGGPGPSSGYQWQYEGEDLSGETGATLTLSGLTDMESGRYRCVVRNTCGENISRYCTLLVRTADVGQQGGIPGGDGMLDNNDFVVFIDRFFAHEARADYGAQGGLPGPDGEFDNNDFIVFIDLFFSGCS